MLARPVSCGCAECGGMAGLLYHPLPSCRAALPPRHGSQEKMGLHWGRQTKKPFSKVCRQHSRQ